MEEVQENKNDEYIIGIDLGTTNTCVGIWRNDRIEIIPDEHGNKTIPSFVAYTNVSRYIGLDAKNQKELNPSNVYYEVKRLIGRKIDDPYVKRELDFLSYKVGSDENSNVILLSDLDNNRTFTPEEISSAILAKVKKMASNYLKCDITKCIITVPAVFNDGQRQATKDASIIAGLDCIRMINEPTSAALAYGLLRRSDMSDKEKKIMVYDFGGGTLDVSLLNINEGIFEVLYTAGNTRLGGSDFDNRIISFCVSKFKKQNKIDKIDEISSLSLQKLRNSCEQAKKILSSLNKTIIAVKDFYDEKDLYINITRKDFEKLCYDLFLVCLKPVDDILNNCCVSSDEIDEIILVGGMTMVPRIRELLKMKFNKEPNCSVNPEEAVAIGAAIQGYILTNNNDAFTDSISLLDVSSLSLGVEINGGLMSNIVDRGSIIPLCQSKMYSTDKDNMESVMIKIYEGERKMTKDNFFVGEFELCGLEPEPRGMPEIEVSFNIDQNGIITVTAINKKTDYSKSLIVTSNKGRLTKEKIEYLINDSKYYEAKDELEKMKKMYHSEINEFCYNILYNIRSKLCKLKKNDIEFIENDIKKIIEWLKEKQYDERSDEEYVTVYENMKNTYGVLILTGKLEKNDVSAIEETKNSGVTIYGTNEEDAELKYDFEKLENNEFGYDELDETEKVELKELRQAVKDLCYSINDILYSDNLQISKEHIKELKDYIDDSLLWIHIHSKPTKTEYVTKLEEIDKMCNNIFEYYEKNNEKIFVEDAFTLANKNEKDELENLCWILKTMINDGTIGGSESLLLSLIEKIDEIINWINDNTDNTDVSFYEECINKRDYLNNQCYIIQNKNNGINLDEIFKKKSDVILTGSVDDEIKIDNGTSIFDLVRTNQKNIIETMLND